VQERLTAGGGQHGKSCEQADGHPGDLQTHLDEHERTVDRQRYLGGDTSGHCGIWPGQTARDDLGGGVAEQEPVQSLQRSAVGAR
jgi:hypothetical protein